MHNGVHFCIVCGVTWGYHAAAMVARVGMSMREDLRPLENQLVLTHAPQGQALSQYTHILRLSLLGTAHYWC